MKKLVLSLSMVFAAFSLNAQTVEELKKDLGEKKSEIKKLQGEAKSLKSKIDALPGWKYGAFGTIGANFSGFNNWYTNAIANSSAGNIGVTVNGFANLTESKYFWRNSGVLNLGWVKLDNTKISTDSADFNATTDVFTITSLFGYKVSEKLAMSALGEYRTAILKNFNKPGYLDIGVGATWTPIKELVVVVHPLNYNFIFGNDSGGLEYTSSLGAKIVADYNKNFGKVKFRSNLSAFQSYKSSDLSNFTWVNSLGFNIWKGIGVGLEGGLRGNKQESFNYYNKTNPTNIIDPDNLGTIKTTVQTYWLAGVTYGF